MSGSGKMGVLEMVGSFCRYAAVLFAVFVPLKYALTGAVPTRALITAGILVPCLFIIGVIVERNR